MEIINLMHFSILIAGIFFITFIAQSDSRTISQEVNVRQPSSTVHTIPDHNEISNVIETEVKEQAMEKLFQVFGLENHTSENEVGASSRGRRQRPPPFMLNLYNSVADSTSGITRMPNPYHANTVRAFQDKALHHRMRFEFNLSRVTSDEHLLQAELHLFKMKPKRYDRNNPRMQGHYQIHLHQLLGNADSTTDGARLIGVRLISAARSGWEVFTITDAARNWLEDGSTNHGILITVTTLTGEPIEDNIIRFAQRGRHHDTKQPIMVMFTNDVTRKMSPKTKFEEPDYVYDYIQENYGDNANWHQFNSVSDSMSDPTQPAHTNHYTESSTRTRLRRDSENTISVPAPTEKDPKEDFCQRQSMYVDFEKIGWSSWVISPKGYDAFHCKGTCQFPLGLSQNPSNHATVQSIMNALNLGEDVGAPCCVPSSLFAVSLLYFDNDGNVVLKQYADMVAANCGCH